MSRRAAAGDRDPQDDAAAPAVTSRAPLDGLRLAVTLLTALPLRGPRVLDRTTATGALRWFVPVGVLLAAPPVALLALADARLDDDARSGPASLLLAVGVVAYLAALTRGLHLDGLADTADALGVHGGHDDPQARERALAAAKDPAVGAFGVVTLVLVLGLQAAALAVLVADGTAAVAVLAAAVLARAAAALACAPAYPPARSDGLGALVAGAARWHVQLLTVAVMVVVLVVAAAVTGGDEAFPLVAAPAVAVPVVAQTLLRRCTRRLGGVTGDVLGAVVETATTTALVAAAVVALV